MTLPAIKAPTAVAPYRVGAAVWVGFGASGTRGRQLAVIVEWFGADSQAVAS